jgi:predicted DsbA family dithiol-disulfide isomerase
LDQLQQHYDVTLQWHSFQLRPPGSPPLPPEYRARIEASRPRLARQAHEQYGIEMHPGPLETDSHPALIAEKFAEAHGKGAEFHRAVMSAYWQQARTIDDLTTLKELATQVGLSADELEAALSLPQYEQAVEQDIRLAQEYGLEGVPALIFAEKYLVVGAQPYNVLKQVTERVLAEQP